MNTLLLHALSLSMSLAPTRLFAAVFDGGGIEAGINTASSISGVYRGSVRDFVLRIMRTVLDYLALAAVVMIVIAGILLIFSLGNDESKDRAKKIVTYSVIGLIVIIFARVAVGFIIALSSAA